MTDTTVEEEVQAPKKGTGKPASCPECDATWDPMPFARQWLELYKHARAEHGWSGAQVDAHKEARGVIKPDAVSKPSPKGRVDRGRKQRASSGADAAEAAASIGPKNFQKKLIESQKVAKVILEQGNPVLLGMTPMFMGVPAQVLIDPNVGPRIRQVVCFNEGEAMLLGAACVFGDSEWMAKMLEKVLPPALSIFAGAVLVAHGYNVLKLRSEIAQAVAQQVRAQQAQQAAYTNGSAPTEPVVDIS